DTDSPNTHYLCRPRSSRTTEHWRSPPVLDRSLPMPEQRQSPKSCGSSSFHLHTGVSNNTQEVVAISINRVRLKQERDVERQGSLSSCFIHWDPIKRRICPAQ